ncbi:MAG: hypothetical protein V2I33_25465, partial [Kangiellaceae bacterium]|nr:hypothetical protein [Kangiellaceae bacterium]
VITHARLAERITLLHRLIMRYTVHMALLDGSVHSLAVLRTAEEAVAMLFAVAEPGRAAK